MEGIAFFLAGLTSGGKVIIDTHQTLFLGGGSIMLLVRSFLFLHGHERWAWWDGSRSIEIN